MYIDSVENAIHLFTSSTSHNIFFSLNVKTTLKIKYLLTKKQQLTTMVHIILMHLL